MGRRTGLLFSDQKSKSRAWAFEKVCGIQFEGMAIALPALTNLERNKPAKQVCYNSGLNFYGVQFQA